jgi:L-proline---[L-prolyl-carrier protein] ligase
MVFTLPQIIKQSSERFPDKDAFRFGNQSLTFAVLEKRMNQIAHCLIGLGVKRGDRVGIFLNRSLETAQAVYGILNAGAAFVPLDPQAPASRIKFLLEDCGIDHIISSPSQKHRLKALNLEELSLKSIIGIKEDWPVFNVSWEEIWKEQKHSDPEIRILEGDLAYIMYTSGTTGQPKGIMHTHYSGLSYAKLSKALYKLTEHDRVGNHSPLHFDISTFGYFTAPLAGATTVIVSDAHTKMPASLSQLIEKEALTIWYSVPLALTQLLYNGVLDQKDLTSLRWVLFGGEPFPTKHLISLMKMWPKADFSNVYGPAEVNQCTYFTVPENITEDQAVPLGEIWDNTEMLIIDEHGTKVPKGGQGELLIRSATMMQGYWGQPELSKKGFYRSKNEGGFEKVFYRTGDLVRISDDGNLHFLGRKDRQVKSRGFRIELDEVEAAFLRHEAVRETAVFPVKDETYGVLIEAAVVVNEKNDIDDKTLRNHLAGSLPWYAIPQKIYFLNDIPRTNAGKIDHKTLQKQRSNLLET